MGRADAPSTSSRSRSSWVARKEGKGRLGPSPAKAAAPFAGSIARDHPPDLAHRPAVFPTSNRASSIGPAIPAARPRRMGRPASCRQAVGHRPGKCAVTPAAQPSKAKDWSHRASGVEMRGLAAKTQGNGILRRQGGLDDPLRQRMQIRLLAQRLGLGQAARPFFWRAGALDPPAPARAKLLLSMARQNFTGRTLQGATVDVAANACRAPTDSEFRAVAAIERRAICTTQAGFTRPRPRSTTAKPSGRPGHLPPLLRTRPGVSATSHSPRQEWIGARFSLSRASRARRPAPAAPPPHPRATIPPETPCAPSTAGPAAQPRRRSQH